MERAFGLSLPNRLPPAQGRMGTRSIKLQLLNSVRLSSPGSALITICRMPQRTWIKRFGYNSLRAFCRLIAVTFFGMRCRGREHIPMSGPVLVCANHQSYFDPVIVGMVFNRRLNYLARKTLFRYAPFRMLIHFLDAIPLDRDGLGMSGIKECLRRIKDGEMVLIFPEGTRTRDGSMGPLQPGFVMLARRGNVSLLPVGFDGAYDAWPRNAAIPRFSTVHVCIGKPLVSAEIAKLDDAQLVAELERRMRDCHAIAHAGRERAGN